MSTIAAAVRAMLARGVDHETIVATVEAIEASYAPPPSEKTKSGAAVRMARYRERRRANGLEEIFDGASYRPILVERDGPLCIYCADRDGVTVDHMVPISQRGTDHIDNLALACAPCNGGKSGRFPEVGGKYMILSPSAKAAHVRYLSEQSETNVRPELSPEQSEHKPEQSEQTGEHRPVHPLLNNISSLVLETEQKESQSGLRPGSTTRGTRITEGWEPSDRDVLYAKGQGLNEGTIKRQAQRFRDYYLGLAGPKATRLDWPASWRTWIGNHIDRNGSDAVTAQRNGGGY